MLRPINCLIFCLLAAPTWGQCEPISGFVGPFASENWDETFSFFSFVDENEIHIENSIITIPGQGNQNNAGGTLYAGITVPFDCSIDCNITVNDNISGIWCNQVFCPGYQLSGNTTALSDGFYPTTFDVVAGDYLEFYVQTCGALDGCTGGLSLVVTNWTVTPTCISGCTDTAACNFDPEATLDDGQCQYPDGCTDPAATNFNPDAMCDDGSCVYGCDCNLDETGPQFIDLPESITVPCSWTTADLSPEVLDACGVTSVIVEALPPSQASLSYAASNTLSQWSGDSLAMVLTVNNESRLFELTSSTYTSTGEGYTLTGTLEEIGHPGNGFDVYWQMEDLMDWAEWSSQAFPTGYKDDTGLVGDSYLCWEYMKLASGSSLSGFGSFAGSSGSIFHAPQNFFYAMQQGIAANNYSGSYGMGGWFFFEGPLVEDGTTVDFGAVGTLAVDVEVRLEEGHTVEVTATDGCGNETTQWVQVLFESSECNANGFGCTNPDAANYTPFALIEDCSCIFTGCGIPCPADLTADCLVNSQDLLVILGEYGATDYGPADLNSSGIVGSDDLLIMLGEYGVSCE